MKRSRVFLQMSTCLYDVDLSNIAKKRTPKHVTTSFDINNFIEVRCNTEFYRHSDNPKFDAVLVIQWLVGASFISVTEV